MQKRRIHIKTKPVNIDKLIKSAGINNASVSLGVTPSALKKYINADRAPLATEIAAKLLCGSNLNQETALLKADHETIAAVKKLIAGSGTITAIRLGDLHAATFSSHIF